MIDIVERILRLPSMITIDGKTFTLVLFKHSEEEMRLCYKRFTYTNDEKETWYNKYLKRNCSFLFLVEGIGDEEDLLHAIDDTFKFLEENNLLKI